MAALRAIVVYAAIAGALAAGGSLEAGRSAQRQPCTQEFAVAEQSFQRLANRARHAYVWVDDIGTRLFGGYDPFDMYVLVGRTFAPFQAASGRLDRQAFEKIADAGYSTTRFGPFRVTPAAVAAKTASFAFTSGNQRFTLRALAVNTRARAGATVQLQLCE